MELNLFPGGCCGACSAGHSDLDDDDLEAAAGGPLGMGHKCKDSGAFEKFISLGPDHCSR